MSEVKCEVCGENAVGVAGSSVGAMSTAYCGECAERGLEPYSDIVGLSFCIDGLDNAMEELQPMINASLARAGKTREQADAEGRKIMEGYIEDMGRGGTG